MTVDPATSPAVSVAAAFPPPTAAQFGSPPVPSTSDGRVVQTVLRQRPPRPGELTGTWRVIMALTWLAVGLAIGAVWSTSDQLGLATWWLGPRGDPNPQYLQVLVFLPALVMVLVSVNRVRYASWCGVVAASSVIAIGIGDLSRVTALGILEIAIGVVAGAVSLASLTGTYRRQPKP